MKGKKRKESLKPFVFHDLYQVKFNYFDRVQNIWVFGAVENVLTTEGKAHHDLAAEEVKRKYYRCEIVSVTYC